MATKSKPKHRYSTKVRDAKRNAERRRRVRRAARPSAFDKQPAAVGYGPGEEVRQAAAEKLLRESIRIFGRTVR
jgi:hypothetical protein